MTPVTVENRPGLQAIAYRVGTHATFKHSMLARLATHDHPALAELRTREDDDFTIALLDAWALTADVLTFYQERIATESYLRTATEQLSVRELARLIGYQPAPGVAAQTYLAFKLDTTEGAPKSVSLDPLDHKIKVQSVPGPDEKPQTFETVETVELHPEWNDLRPRLTQAQDISPTNLNIVDLYLEGTSTGLQSGDAILIIGDERMAGDSLQWSVRFLLTVAVDSKHDRTHVTWADPLNPSKTPATGVRVFALGQRAALFGHNAPDPRLVKAPDSLATGGEWKDFAPPADRIELDAIYPRIMPGNWLFLTKPSTGGSADFWLFRAVTASTVSRAAYALSGKFTQIYTDDTGKLATFTRRDTMVFAQTAELSLGGAPITTNVDGSSVELGARVNDLSAPRTVAVSGKESVEGPTVNEVAEVIQVEQLNGGTLLHFKYALTHSYFRESVTINANVALATHGETVREVLGGGDPTQPFQHLPLKQAPLTYIHAHTPSGSQSTLEIRVNDLLWHEVPTLYGHGANERIYVTERQEDGPPIPVFGDGVTGARLPRGADNVRARYRKGIGLVGRVKAGQLTTLLTRPLGVKEVANPTPASGADDPDSLAAAKQNAPLTVLTLDRVVSLQDYEDYARSFPGLAKALATWTWQDLTRTVFLTIAGPDGETPDNKLIDDLTTALRSYGDPHVQFTVLPYRPATFRITARVQIDSDHLVDKVLTAVTDQVTAVFSFETRRFAQPVEKSEVIAAIQSAPGVVAVDLDALYRSGNPVDLNDRLPAALPDATHGAELLIADLQSDDVDSMT